jgi:hypothetical protein
MFSHSAEKQPSIFFEFFNRIGRKQALTDEILGSAFEKLLQMDTADSKYCQYVQYNVQTAWIFPMRFRTLRREIAFNHRSIE